ncbi:hypothetical protein N7467_006141 [Penicillium canescens]|nr:hypothetical protein N7467_006141 [Penicillium canescens]
MKNAQQKNDIGYNVTSTNKQAELSRTKPATHSALSYKAKIPWKCNIYRTTKKPKTLEQQTAILAGGNKSLADTVSTDTSMRPIAQVQPRCRFQETEHYTPIRTRTSRM